MRIGIVSDLHLEFAGLDLPNHDNIEVLILGGDICVAEDLYRHPTDTGWLPDGERDHRRQAARRYREFFQQCAERFPHVIYVMGNHEHYHGHWERTAEIIERELSQYSNMRLLDLDQVKINGVRFMGATLWTNLNGGDPITAWQLKQGMNDYRVIRVAERGYRRLLPEDTLREHERGLGYLRENLAGITDPVVVCTHHAPSTMSTHPRYQEDRHMNGGYVSDLSEFILSHPEVRLWTHGHTHDPHDYMVGTTRVVCNPRGYVGHERSPDDVYLAQVVEI